MKIWDTETLRVVQLKDRWADMLMKKGECASSGGFATC